jgi:hypothetical protein
MATYDPRPSDPPPVDPSSSGGLSRGRKALLGVYVAMNNDLRRALQYVNVGYPERLDPAEQLEEAAAAHREDQDRPAVHPLQLAFAALAVMGRPEFPQTVGSVRAVAAELADPRFNPDDNEPAVSNIVTALQEAASPEMPPKERWTYVVDHAGEDLHPDLRRIRRAWCQADLRSVDDEVMSRVETELVVSDPRNLDQLSLAVLPDNWKVCNDFFCDLIRRPDRDADCPGSTQGLLSPAASHWRGVYEERVGECPDGWFPDTYLAFTWDRTPSQTILRYELAPHRHGDRTVLKIDQGYIQVDRLPDTYNVSTLKNLLFDDDFIPSGGQVLGAAACQLGWLDYCVNQFTVCTDTLDGTKSKGPATADGPDPGLNQILDRCQAHLQEAASDADKRFTKAAAKVRDGRYSLDDYVNDWAGAMRQGIRDGARSLAGQAELARELLDQAAKLARRGGERR